MTARITLKDLIRDAGITPIPTRQPLPAPSQPAIIASEDDHAVARQLLVQQRRNNPEYKDPNKQLKRIFRSSKEKEKLENPARWEFTQAELDEALSAVVDQPTSSPGLVQAFLSLGAKVNFVDLSDDKKHKSAKQSNVSVRRRTKVLQRATTVRRADSVGLLASAGADQTTLDEALKTALAANDQACIQELLRHGADVNKYPNALADAVRSNDQNLVRLLLRAPKAFRTEIISSTLAAAVQLKSEQILSLLLGYGADPNFNGASALYMAILQRDYRLAVALVAGPVRPMPASLQKALEPVLRMPTVQELFQYLQLLFCCGLPPNSAGLSVLLAAACKTNDASLASLLLDNGVSITAHGVECLQSAISNANWTLARRMLQIPLSPADASRTLARLPTNAPKTERLTLVDALLRKGANGPPVEAWLTIAVQEKDTPLMDLIVNAGPSVDSKTSGALHVALQRKDRQSIELLLQAKPTPQALSRGFPLLWEGYSPSERQETARLLLEHGARGPEVDQSLVRAVSEKPSSRDISLIMDLLRYGADVEYENGKCIQVAAEHADLAVLELLCKRKLSARITSAALPLTFDKNGRRRDTTLRMIGMLLAHGIEDPSALKALQQAVRGGPANIDIIDRFLEADARLVPSALSCIAAVDDPEARSSLLVHLLQRNPSQETLNETLLNELQYALTHGVTSTVKLLLDCNASVNHRDGEGLHVAVSAGSVALTTMLLKAREPPNRSTVTRAFRGIFKEGTSSNSEGLNDRIAIIEALLDSGVDQPAIDSALRIVLDETSSGSDYGKLVDLLLGHNASVNTADGTCFVFAARRRDCNLLDKLLGHNPDFSVIVPTLLASQLPEDVLIRLLEKCFTHGLAFQALETTGDRTPHIPVLLLAMQHFPRGSALVQLLLDHGCNPDVIVSGIVEPVLGAEPVSALIWALSQPQKTVSTTVIQALVAAGASRTRTAPLSELSPIALAAREGRQDVVQMLLDHGADASVRDKWNRSALFYASSGSLPSLVQTLAPHALRDDGSLHEAARCLQLDISRILIKEGHKPNFPCRLHGGRSALGELCLNAEVTNGIQRTKARQLIRLLLEHGANPKFKARNERSSVILALDNPRSPLEVTEALLDTEVWEEINDEKHMFRDEKGFWYSPIKYVELVPSASRARNKQDLTELLRDKGCEPKFYSENPEQPEGAVGMPASIAELADRQKAHLLSLKLAKEANDHNRMLEEANHRDMLRRKKEHQDADMAVAAAAQAQWLALEQAKHDFEVERVQSAERMKRNEKITWHKLQMEQERESAAQRQQIEDRKASATFAHEAKLAKQRQAELEHRAGVERKALLEKEQLFERNMNRQKQLTDRLDESAQLHARLRQERPAIEPAKWGSVD
ncbi:ankyrin [Westerdykella ornata]|uniref:Ankyrin n=1 Tax=Westerdykella ornata TaxID=318751 RepID=A0A6A6K087_WESOR|nr:ankyrin [Westerdykella ornata]KAF2281456.1 ankyrin [Westerdykella ornata]